jgi:crotonobetaine/carnitine-CoA ligase
MRLAEQGFVHLLRDAARADPDGLYARFDGVPVTFARLEAQSAALAAHLRGRGLKRGERVAVMMRNSIPALGVIFGLARAGLVWVPVNAQQRGEGLRYQLHHCDPCLVIADADLVAPVREAMAEKACPVIANGGDGEAGLAAIFAGPAGFDEPAPGPDDPFAIMYTSGTTGPPKGAIVSHRMLCLATEAVLLVSACGPGDVFFVWEALYHIGGAQLLPLPLSHGIRFAMVDRFSASRFWQQAKAEGATHIHHLGGILQLLLKQPPSDIDRSHGVRVAWGGGCPPDIWSAFEARFGIPVRECYGMTEASSITTYNDTGLVGSVGRPVPWFDVELIGPDGRPVARGERGEIVVRTSLPGAIFPGYFRNPEATRRALRDGALHTGDLGSFDADGNMFFHGRMSDSVRCKGENVSAWEVEHVAAAHPDVEDCAMIGVSSDVGEQDIKLFVKFKPGHGVDEPTLSAWLAERLAPYQNPRYLAIVPDFERTASQRIMKHKLSKDLDDCWDRLAGA